MLRAARRGDEDAAADLLPIVYDELRKLADSWMVRKPPGQTLQPTALVHETYLRPKDSPPPSGRGLSWF
jgi:hypothetical protein